MNGFEIERRLSVKKGGAFKRAVFSSSHTQQGYISCLNVTARTRVRNDEVYLTIKGESTRDGMMRCESKTKITLEEASHLLQFCQGDIIDRRRYLVRSGNRVLEMSELYGDNEGLAMAEVELKSENEPYEKPDFTGSKVTGDACFYNKYILMNPFSAWEDMLPEEYRQVVAAQHRYYRSENPPTRHCGCLLRRLLERFLSDLP